MPNAHHMCDAHFKGSWEEHWMRNSVLVLPAQLCALGGVSLCEVMRQVLVGKEFTNSREVMPFLTPWQPSSND